MPTCTLLVEQFPIDGLLWFREFHNDFHEGDELTLCQVFDMFPTISAEWDVNKIEAGIDTKTGKDLALDSNLLSAS